jgi:hypothetical protein
LASGRLSVYNESPVIELRIAGWKKQIDLLKRPARKTKKPTSLNKPHKPVKMPFSLIKELFLSFKVNQFRLNLDLGNMPLNGMVYPLFYWARTYLNKPIEVNFIGEREFILEVENNFAIILKTIIYQKLKNKNHGKSK